MGLRTSILKSLLKAEGSVATKVATLPENWLKTLSATLGKDERFSNADDIMKVILASHHLLNVPLISKNPQESRRLFEQRMQSIRSTPLALHSVTDITMQIPDSKPLAGRLYVANDNPEPSPIMVFFHGGGFTIGSINTHDDFCRYFCQYAQMPVLSVSYRLAPEEPAPAALHDCMNALEWVFNHAKNLAMGDLNHNRINIHTLHTNEPCYNAPIIDTNKIYVAGDSAGGNLAALVAQQNKNTPYKPAAQLLIYPVTDMLRHYPSYNQYGKGLPLTMQDKKQFEYFYVYSGKLKPNDPKVMPMNGDVNHVAPAYVVTAELDLLVDEGEAYAHKLRKAGVPTYSERMYGLPHGFINLINVHPESKLATIKLARGFRTFVEQL